MTFAELKEHLIAKGAMPNCGLWRELNDAFFAEGRISVGVHRRNIDLIKQTATPYGGPDILLPVSLSWMPRGVEFDMGVHITGPPYNLTGAPYATFLRYDDQTEDAIFGGTDAPYLAAALAIVIIEMMEE